MPDELMVGDCWIGLSLAQESGQGKRKKKGNKKC